MSEHRANEAVGSSESGVAPSAARVPPGMRPRKPRSRWVGPVLVLSWVVFLVLIYAVIVRLQIGGVDLIRERP